MKLSIPLFTILAAAACVALAEQPQLPNKSCSITCYEKTPTCYVTKDSTGCLVITNTKLKCSKGQCVCEIKGCEKKTTY